MSGTVGPATGAKVGAGVGVTVGPFVGLSDGSDVGSGVGSGVGEGVGRGVDPGNGMKVGNLVGKDDGSDVEGVIDGVSDGDSLGVFVGLADGAAVGVKMSTRTILTFKKGFPKASGTFKFEPKGNSSPRRLTISKNLMDPFKNNFSSTTIRWHCSGISLPPMQIARGSSLPVTKAFKITNRDAPYLMSCLC